MNRDAFPRIVLLAMFLLSAAASFAAAGGPPPSGQSQPSTPAAQQGPLVIEPIESGFVLTPEARFTRIDGWSATLMGGYGGWLVSDAILVGAGGYGIVSGPSHIDMHYGGIVVGLDLPVDDRLRLGARGLFGFGEARLVDRLPVPCPNPSVDFAPCFQAVPYHQNFVVFEPQIILGARLGRKLTFELAGGYRVIGGAGGRNGRLEAGFASAGLRFGPF